MLISSRRQSTSLFNGSIRYIYIYVYIYTGSPLHPLLPIGGECSVRLGDRAHLSATGATGANRWKRGHRLPGLNIYIHRVRVELTRSGGVPRRQAWLASAASAESLRRMSKKRSRKGPMPEGRVNPNPLTRVSYTQT